MSCHCYPFLSFARNALGELREVWILALRCLNPFTTFILSLSWSSSDDAAFPAFLRQFLSFRAGRSPVAQSLDYKSCCRFPGDPQIMSASHTTL